MDRLLAVFCISLVQHLVIVSTKALACGAAATGSRHSANRLPLQPGHATPGRDCGESRHRGHRDRSCRSTFRRLVALLAFFLTIPAFGHDPSAWGGTYRTRDFGRSWLSADAGLFIGASVDLAVSPVDANHLLYATDTRLLRSHNAGRDWIQEAPGIFFGPTLAVAFSEDGNTALASTAAGMFRSRAGEWQSVSVAQSAIPVRRIATGIPAAPLIALGAQGVYVSKDDGASFRRTGAEVLPETPATGIAVQDGTIWLVVGGDLWHSADGIAWSVRGAGLPKGRMEAVFADRTAVRRIWAAGADRVFVSDDGGTIWRAVGHPLSEPGTAIRNIAVDGAGRSILLATHRGLLRSEDGGDTWDLAQSATLPVHLEAGPLRNDPHSPGTWYVGFSLMPYQELWRRAEQGTNLLSQVDPLSLIGLAAFLILLLLAGIMLARYLAARGADMRGRS